MPAEWKPVPLIMPPNENVDDVQVDEESATIVDGIPIVVNKDELHIVKRPGLEEWVDLGTSLPIDGLYWADDLQAVVAVSAGRVWKIIDSGGTKQELTGSTGLLSSAIVTFDDDGDRVFMANGGPIVYTDLNTLTTLADTDAPQVVSHLAIVDGYLHAVEVATGRDHFSSVTDLLDWNALDFVTAESKPDDIVAMDEAYRELIMLGRRSVEFFVNDGVTPFVRIPGSAQPFGTEAPYSLAQVGQSWMWLSQLRKFVTMQGRAVVEVSSPYDKLIQGFASVDDAIGYTVSIEGYPLYILNFPTAKTTLAYNYKTQIWHKWGYWNSDTATYQRFRGQSYCYARAWNAHLVGDYDNGKIYKMKSDVYTDAGNPMRTLLRSGHLNHGVDFKKRSDIFRLRCKRGVANEDCPDPKVMLRRRIDNKGVWSNERWKSLGKTGDHKMFIDWRRNGQYITCQFELIHSDPTEFIVMGASEFVTPLFK